jgi:hypothetical protein
VHGEGTEGSDETTEGVGKRRIGRQETAEYADDADGACGPVRKATAGFIAESLLSSQITGEG